MKIKDVKIEKEIKVNNKDAIIIVDMQNDFIPGGALPVKEGDLIINDINEIIEIFKNNGGKIVFTQDWHPKNHLSFASNHPGKSPGDNYTSENGAIGPVLWPDHCIQNSQGAEFHKDLKIDLADKIIKKGMNYKVDSYSGFLDNDKKIETGLDDYLRLENIQRIFICGLALDYCCFATAMDGINLGYDVFFIIDLTRGVDIPPGNISKALEAMTKKNIKFVHKVSFKS
ncbi:MAG: bifunctional nicotinamidase/pyrazinamidase [Promethearchaeota archaeon]